VARARQLNAKPLGRYQRLCFTNVVKYREKFFVTRNTTYVEQAMFLDMIKTRYQALECAPTRGCTPAEIRQLAHQLTRPLPLAYAEFLAWAGHDAGNLFLDTEEYTYAAIPEFQTAAQATLTASGIAFSLPDDAIVIQLDFPAQFAFIRTSEGDDPPVYHFAWFPPEMIVTVTTAAGTETKTIQTASTSPARIVQSKPFSGWLADYIDGLEENSASR
jgi:hypothetical protein